MFKSWLISNIGFVFGFIYAILSLIFMNRFPTSELGIPGFGFFFLFVSAAFVASLSVMLSDSGFIGSILVGLVSLLIIAIGLFLVWGGATGFKDLTASVARYGAGFAVFFIAAFVISVLVAIFAYANFDDVVDSRWLYRHSDVSIYEEEWKYALNRFAVTMGGFWGMAVLIGLVLEAPNILAA